MGRETPCGDFSARYPTRVLFLGVLVSRMMLDTIGACGVDFMSISGASF